MVEHCIGIFSACAKRGVAQVEEDEDGGVERRFRGAEEVVNNRFQFLILVLDFVI